MSNCDKNVVIEILRLIDRNEYQQALKVWRDYRQETTGLCSPCPYEDADQAANSCCQCLEAKLRTLSLYQHDGDSFETLLVEGARKLKAYDCQKHGSE